MNLNFDDHDVYGTKSLPAPAVNMVFMVALSLLVRIALYWARDQEKKHRACNSRNIRWKLSF